MTGTSHLRFIFAATFLSLLLLVGVVHGSENSLIVLDKRSQSDRNALIEAGVTLVAEGNDMLIAIGSPEDITTAAAARSLSTVVVATNADDERFALAGLRPGFTESDLSVCGEVIAKGSDWNLVKGSRLSEPDCFDSTGWFIHELDMDPLAPTKAPPAANLGPVEAIPLVQEMVDRVDRTFALAHWSALSESPGWTTRYSGSQGCVDASTYVQDRFNFHGLTTDAQYHTTGYAPNVVGTLPGVTDPDMVYIAIGHLDDLPASGSAPGADDNASGSAMVTALAEIMSDYCFERTTKFITVTGEEQGLYGSDHYADAAAAAGENIQAVLNGDMIGWEGNGQPAIEDLDVNYNSGSQWLAQAMVDAAADYSTGLPINAFLCPSMTYSDHSPFWNNGFSAICGITDNEGYCGQTGNYPYYHQSSDTIANCGPGAPDFEAAVIRTYLATMAHLAVPVGRVPVPPGSLNATSDGDNRIALSWSDQGPGASYQVYRSVGGCADPDSPVFIGETDTTSFVDTSASGGVLYAYTFTTTTAGSCTSKISACVETTTTGSCDEPPRFAGVESVENAETNSCRLDLAWQPPQDVWCGGPVVYKVYRSTTPGFTPSTANLIAEMVSTPSFSDNDVVFSEDYHYIVRAVDLAGGGEDDNLYEVSASPTGPNIIGPWSDDAGDTGSAKLIQSSPWTVVAGAGLTGAAYATGAYGDYLCSPLATPILPLGANPQLEFWTRYEIESAWDKGELQISADAGASWQRVPLAYPASSSYTADDCDLGTGSFFTGSNSDYTPFSADLSNWANQGVSLRWLLSTDSSVNGAGWWIDEISITDYSMCTTANAIFTDGFESGDTGAWGP